MPAGQHLTAAGFHPGDAPVVGQKAGNVGPGADLHAPPHQLLVHVAQDVAASLGAQVADRVVQQLQAGVGGAVADLLDLVPLAVVGLAVRAEPHPQRIHFLHQLFRFGIAPDVGQQAPDLGGDGQLAIAKSAGASPAGHQRAGGALQAAARFPRRAATLVQVRALVQHQHPRVGAAPLRSGARFRSAPGRQRCRPARLRR